MQVLDIEVWYKEAYEKVKACRLCDLYKTCLQAVPGHGNLVSKLMLIGEGPGADEDLQGKPFVGRSGKLLNKILEETGFHRDDFYVTNIIKCRPPDNRTPTDKETWYCTGHLSAEIAVILPTIIVTLGYTAFYCVAIRNFGLGQFPESMGAARTRVWADAQVPDPIRILYPTYHPSYALRNPDGRFLMVRDFEELRKYIDSGYNLNTLTRRVKIEAR